MCRITFDLYLYWWQHNDMQEAPTQSVVSFHSFIVYRLFIVVSFHVKLKSNHIHSRQSSNCSLGPISYLWLLSKRKDPQLLSNIKRGDAYRNVITVRIFVIF